LKEILLRRPVLALCVALSLGACAVHATTADAANADTPIAKRNLRETFTTIPNARPEDFRKATQRVYHAPETPSGLQVMVMPAH
jgi:hypothetical protein